MISRLLRVTDLTLSQRNAMRSLLAAHFEGVASETFDADLAAKSHAILLYDAHEQLAGFSTLLAYDSHHEGQPIQVIVSGDTIVSKAAWGSSALARGWIQSVNQIRNVNPACPCYWLLITSGFRTYRFLPVFWKRFYPRFDAPTPPAMQQLLNRLARAQYGAGFDEQTGIVRLPHPQVLRPELAGIPPERTADPHVRFFAERNPGSAHGDELVSLCELGPENLTPAGQRMVGAR